MKVKKRVRGCYLDASRLQDLNEDHRGNIHRPQLDDVDCVRCSPSVAHQAALGSPIEALGRDSTCECAREHKCETEFVEYMLGESKVRE